ncbi:nuclear localized protein isoform X2 [Carex rostrata]
MAESTSWEERLDVDDSDLFTIVPSISSFPLRPCSSRSTNPSVENPRSVSPPRLIPGPAGAVQAAMHRVKMKDVCQDGSQREEIGWRVGGSMDLGEEVDGDFQLDSWIYAMRYLGTESNSVTPIGSIRTRTIGRIPMVVGLVKSCTSNGLGDLVLTLKDQTGTICASIHHKALLERTLGSDVAVGCVLILKQLIGKNCGPIQEHLTSAVETRFQDNGKRKEENRLMEQSLINSGLENHAQIRSSAIEQTRSEKVDFCGIISRLNPKANKVSTICTDKMPGDDLFSKISKENTSVKILKGNMQPNQGNDAKEMPVSKVSIPEWTDEQLSELFADY